MLFGYDVAATQDNWIHSCLCEAIRTVHSLVEARKRYPKWPNVLPKAYRTTLKSRTGLRDHLKAYATAIRKLDKANRDLVLEALESENRVMELLSGACDCIRMEQLPAVIRNPVERLFGYAFDLLSDFPIRNQHYAAIYANAPSAICPFCGIEPFDAPDAPREALDHYLVKSKYPFAASNLRNLVPMGHKCNSSYKLAQDMVRRADGSRRVAFDPYNHKKLTVSLEHSEPFGGTEEHLPKWDIRFDPDSAQVTTWDEVFSIRERYRRDHLDPSFRNWLALFAKVARRQRIQRDSDRAVVAMLRRLEELYFDSGLHDRGFLKAAMFRMLRMHCEAGHRRLLDELRTLVHPATAVAPVRSPTT